jgi:hypothetical protein
VRVLELCGDLDLAGEPLGAEGGGELGSEDLYGDLPMMLQVFGEIHRRHAALAELALDCVTVGEGGAELVQRGGGHQTQRFAGPAALAWSTASKLWTTTAGCD